MTHYIATCLDCAWSTTDATRDHARYRAEHHTSHDALPTHTVVYGTPSEIDTYLRYRDRAERPRKVSL